MELYIQFLRVLYTIGFYLAFPVILLRLLWRSRKNSHYRHRWNERFGYIKRLAPHEKSIWVHAVSVGEAIAAIPLIRELKKRHPDLTIIVTNTTPTGSAQIKSAFNNEILHFFTPFDVSNAVNRFIRRINPQLCVIMETEMWPNLLRCLRRRKIPVMLANARLSERSKKNYKIISNITRHMLSTYTIVSAQGLLDGERFIELGLDPKKLMISGNIKFDIALPADIEKNAEELRQKWGTSDRPTVIAASTHEGEEIILLQAFRKIQAEIPTALLIIVPRHPGRFEKVGKLCAQSGYRFVSRSKNEMPTADTDILLGDTIRGNRRGFCWRKPSVYWWS
jgi:3-deoxy-D-manno-octulosonic-acid transferase